MRFLPSPPSLVMTKDDCFQLGHITKTHGLNGEVVFYLDVDDPKIYADLDSILVEIKGELLPYFIESLAIVKASRAIVAFEDVETIEQAERFINCPLWLPLDNLEVIQDNDRFYFHEIVGMTVIDSNHGELGVVKGVYAMNAQDLIAMDYKGQEVLIPINSDITKTVDRAKQHLNVTLPDGLLEIYFDEKAAETTDDEGQEMDSEDDDSDEN
jgi:16S rRNA processing protein RimM